MQVGTDAAAEANNAHFTLRPAAGMEMVLDSEEGRAESSSSGQQVLGTPPPVSAGNILDAFAGATSSAARRTRIIFNFGTREDTPPVAGPSTASPTPEIFNLISDDSDEELPDLLLASQAAWQSKATGSGSTSTSGAGPSTPTRSQVPIKESDSQHKNTARNGKGKGPAVEIEISDTGDSDIEFIGDGIYIPPPKFIDLEEELNSPDKLPASQAVLNSGRRSRNIEPGEESLTQTPKRDRGSRRRARPSASHARGRHSWGNGSASMSLSMSPTSAALAATTSSSAQEAVASTSRSARVLEELTELHEFNLLSSAERGIGRSSQHLPDIQNENSFFENNTEKTIPHTSRRSPSVTPALSFSMQDLDITGPVDPAFFEGSFLEQRSTQTTRTEAETVDASSNVVEAYDFTDVPYGGSGESDDNDVDIVKDTAIGSESHTISSHPMNTLLPSGSETEAPSTSRSSSVNINDMLGKMLQAVPELSRRQHISPLKPSASDPHPLMIGEDGLPLTPPDIVVTESKSSRPGSPAQSGSKTYTLLRSPSRDMSVEILERRARVARRYRSASSEAAEISSDTDSEPVAPRERRRDLVIVSEAKDLRRKHARVRRKGETMPELRFDSAESTASVESDFRQPTPSSSNETGRKPKMRKGLEITRPLGSRHRNAIVWTGRELPGEFRDVIGLDGATSTNQRTCDQDGYDRARWESLVNDQLAKEEPFAPRVRVIDRQSEYSSPPLNFTYTNRLIYRPHVPSPTKKEGCGCTDGCRADNENCLCARKQAQWTRRIAPDSGFTGFAYDTKGRVILPDDVPIVECDSNCACPADCINRQISNGRRYPLDIVKTLDKGWGIEAASDQPSIRKGSFLCIYSGEIITWKEGTERGQLNDDGTNPVSYLFDIDSRFMKSVVEEFELNGFQIIGDSSLPASASQETRADQIQQYSENSCLYTVDAMKYGNIGRFFNHACSPNAHIRAVFCDDGDEFKPILAVFAKKKIYPGDEITISYRGMLEGASEDHDSTTDEDIRGTHMSASKRALITARNGKRKKRSWRQEATSGRGRGRGRGRGGRKTGGKGGKKGAPVVTSVIEAACHCGSANCVGFMFDRADQSTDIDEAEL